MHRLSSSCSSGRHLGARLRAAGGLVGDLRSFPGPPWFQQSARFSVYHTPSSPSDTQWSVQHRVKVAPTLAKLRPVFDVLRADREQEISKERCMELCPRLPQYFADALFDAFDKSSCGSLSYNELCAFVLVGNTSATPEEKLESLFPLCDVDGDHVVSIKELMPVITLIYDACYKDSEYAAFKVAQLLEEVESEADDDVLSIRQFTEWSRSGKQRVMELFDVLSQPIPFLMDVGDSETWSIEALTEFTKIKVENPIVELDGDEMTRILWQMIKEKLVFPFLDMDIDYYDLSITYRDETEDTVLIAAAEAIRRSNVGIKCATIKPDEQRTLEYGLMNLLADPNEILHNALDGTVFRVPIITQNIPRCVPGWEKPIIVARPMQAEAHQSSQFEADAPGTLKFVFEPEESESTAEVATHAFTGSGAMMGMCSSRESVENFANSCFRYALSEGMPLYFSSRSPSSSEYDSMFVEVFEVAYESSYRKAFEEAGLWYQHVLMTELVTQAIQSNGGFVWACQNYDGDVLADMIAHGSAPLSLTLSTLMCADGQTMLAEAAHGTLTPHYREYQSGEKTSINPIASIFAWSRGLAHRAKLDGNEALARFSAALEEACISCVENGQMSKDLALCVYGDRAEPHQWLLTEELLDAIVLRLRLLLLKPLRKVHISQETPFGETKDETASDVPQYVSTTEPM